MEINNLTVTTVSLSSVGRLDSERNKKRVQQDIVFKSDEFIVNIMKSDCPLSINVDKRYKITIEEISE